MLRLNKAIELLEQDQPVYYTSTAEMTYENGKRMCHTWADYIRLDLEHGPFDLKGVRDFMRGLHDAGPIRSGHPCPAAIAELPTDGTSGDVMLANAWMIKQLLAQGVHGVLLCHAESPQAVQVFVESARFSFCMPEKGLGQGRRGHGGVKLAAEVWGVAPEKYLEIADPWPLNPHGELLLGIKCENVRAATTARQSIAVPGIAFAEWGSGDMCMSHGFMHKPKPLTPELAAIRKDIVDACAASQVKFLCIADKDNIRETIDDGARILRVYDPEAAVIGRTYTNRTMPV